MPATPAVTTAVLGLALSAALAGGAAAQERELSFAVRAGIGAAPAYPGADDYRAAPDLALTFGSLKWGRLDFGEGVGAQPRTGFALRGAFRYIGERDDADFPELAGLQDIDPAVELGIGAIYREQYWQAFGEVRQGFGGHHGVTGTLGADMIFRPDNRWTVTLGPRVNLGNTEYASTYYGVTAAEAAASRFNAFDAEGGVLGVGAALEATYRISDDWAVNGLLSYEKLQNDAADSPITINGSDDQWTARIGISRAITLRF